jgi:hypothetical protein
MPGTYEIEVRFTPGDPSRFEEFLDCVADQLVKVGIEPDYTAVLADLTVTWAIDVPDASEESLIDALRALRTELLAAGCEDATALRATSHEVVAARLLAPA